MKLLITFPLVLQHTLKCHLQSPQASVPCSLPNPCASQGSVHGLSSALIRLALDPSARSLFDDRLTKVACSAPTPILRSSLSLQQRNAGPRIAGLVGDGIIQAIDASRGYKCEDALLLCKRVSFLSPRTRRQEDFLLPSQHHDRCHMPELGIVMDRTEMG